MVTVTQSGDTIVNRLKAAKTLIPDGGMPAKIIEGLINGQGLSSLMQNPLSAIQSQLTGQISNAISQLTSAGGMGSLISALGSGATGLQGALNGLVGQASSLLGLGGSGVTGYVNTIAQGGLSNLLSEFRPQHVQHRPRQSARTRAVGRRSWPRFRRSCRRWSRGLSAARSRKARRSRPSTDTPPRLTPSPPRARARSTTVTAAAADIGAANAVGAVIMDNTTPPLLKEALRISIKPEPLASIDAVQNAAIEYMNEGRELLPKPEDMLNELKALEAYVASLNPEPPPPTVYYPASSGVG